MQDSEFHSKFGGMWIDRDNWRAELKRRLSARDINKAEARLLTRFASDGFVILPGAAALRSVAAFQRVIADGFAKGNPVLRYQSHGQQETKVLTAAVDRLGTRVVDSFVGVPQALDLFSSPALLRFLRLISMIPRCYFRA